MKRTFYYFILTLQMVNWVSATTRAFAPNDAILPDKQGLISEDSLETKEGIEERNEMKEKEEEYYRGMRKIGSSPPSCEDKCYGCIPCKAIQVPTTNRRSQGQVQVGLQYTNYQPEGWKCKCGLSFYSP